MAKRPTTTDITNVLNSASRINANYDAIEVAFDNTISRDGSTPNQMAADFDLNGNDILNAASITATTITLNGQELVVDSVVSRAAINAAVAAAEAARDTAVTANTNAQAAATAAGTSATASAASATNSANSANTASTQVTLATAQANAAATSATAAAGSATSASTSASNSSSSATNSATSATASATSATNSANSATAAATSATNAAASFDSFDDRYLGSKSANPTTDNDGNALLTGALYWNTTDDEMRVYTGSAWQAVAPVATNALLVSNNLSDLNSASTARTNLGLGALSTASSVNLSSQVTGTLAGGSVSQASATARGTVELATTAEGDTGTDTSRVPAVSVVKSMIDTHAGGSGGGAWVAIGSPLDISSASSADFTAFDSSLYTSYAWEFRNANAGNNFFMRTSSDGGSTYDSGTNNYYQSWHNQITSAGQDRVWFAATATRVSGWFYLHSPHTSTPTDMTWLITEGNTTSSLVNAGGASRVASEDVDAVRFYPQSGSFPASNGTIQMYALRSGS